MKKFSVFAAVICMLFLFAPRARAAGSASLSGPSTVRAGDTVTLSFRAGGGILGGSGTLSYDSSVLTFQGFSQSIGGSWAAELTGNRFVFYDNAMANPIQSSTTIFTLSFTVNANAAPGTALSVTASGVTLSDGEQDLSAGSPSWSTTVAPPLSSNCDLASLSVSSGMSPAFSPNVTAYSASVPFTTASVTVNAQAADSKAKVSVSNPQLTAGGTTEIRVTVTAENGAVKVYTVRVARAQDPNYVPSGNADLESLTVAGEIFSLYDDPANRVYYLWLPHDTESVQLSGKPADSKASVSVGQIPQLTEGGVTSVSVTVTAENGTQQVYTVHIFRQPALADMGAFFQAVEDARENATAPTEPDTTQPATEPTEATVPPLPTETEPQPTASLADSAEKAETGLLLWVCLSVLGGVLLGFAITFLATRPRKK